MGKEADAKAGLLGKVARFIRNPTTDWADVGNSDLPSPQPGGFDTLQSRLALKEMIQRKRRNDLVRKREFDKLRKIRRKSKNQNDGLNTMELVSSYSSTQLVHDIEKPGGLQKREQTLRQIDEIEAQLSRAWFKKPSETTTVPMRLHPRQLPPRPASLSTRPAPAGIRNKEIPATSIPISDFAPTTLPTATGMDIPAQPHPPDRLPEINAHSAASPPGSAFKPASIPDQREPPVLTQMYRPEDSKLPPKWKDTAISGLIAESKLGELDLQEFTASDSKPVSTISPLAAARSSPNLPPQSSSQTLPTPEPPRQSSAYENALKSNLEVIALRQDPEIEDAAISFANGDETAAELTLLKLIGNGGGRRNDVEAWLTLFDLYRVTGKSNAFDSLVTEFTALFGRSAPQREYTPSKSLPGKNRSAPQTAPEGIFTWACSSQFNIRALAVLAGVVKRSAPPWRIDWSAVKTVEPDVLPQLNELFTQWASMSAQLQFLGGDRLLSVLAEQSPTEDKSVNPAWWRVRMALLRLMNTPDLFDQTALEYCITYEISPPAWAPPKSSYTPLNTEGQIEAPPADDTASDQPSFARTTVLDPQPTAPSVLAATLDGEILDNADQALAALPGSLGRVQAIEFDCRALRRVDFGAAGALLNWSIEQQSHGRTVTFNGVHRLLAAFFSVIGINTVAQVVLRKD